MKTEAAFLRSEEGDDYVSVRFAIYRMCCWLNLECLPSARVLKSLVLSVVYLEGGEMFKRGEWGLGEVLVVEASAEGHRKTPVSPTLVWSTTSLSEQLCFSICSSHDVMLCCRPHSSKLNDYTTILTSVCQEWTFLLLNGLSLHFIRVTESWWTLFWKLIWPLSASVSSSFR